MMLTAPLISCICITANRPAMLMAAIHYFELQDYGNKELIISFPVYDLASKTIAEQASNVESLQIIFVERPIEESLGNARNNAIRKSSGTYVCIWDDDDWHHASRLSFQYNSMQVVGQRYQASVLSRILLYDASKKKAYVSFSYTWDGTILCRKEILLQNQYADRNRGEDTHVITFLSARKLLYQIADAPFLYIYIYHGSNTWDYKHFEHFINKSELLDQELTEKIINILQPPQ